MPESAPSQEQILSAFVIKMMQDKGVTSLSDEERSRLRMSLQDKLEEQIERALIEMLSDERLVELDKKLDEGATDEEVEAFFLASGADANQVMTDAMKAFREAFMNLPMEQITGGAR